MAGHFMGDEFLITRPAPLEVKARGTKAVSRIEVIRDGTVVYSVNPNREDASFVFTDREGQAGKHYYYIRLQQSDGMLAWSSPMFITLSGK